MKRAQWGFLHTMQSMQKAISSLPVIRQPPKKMYKRIREPALLVITAADSPETPLCHKKNTHWHVKECILGCWGYEGAKKKERKQRREKRKRRERDWDRETERRKKEQEEEEEELKNIKNHNQVVPVLCTYREEMQYRSLNRWMPWIQSSIKRTKDHTWGSVQSLVRHFSRQYFFLMAPVLHAEYLPQWQYYWRVWYTISQYYNVNGRQKRNWR